MMELTPLEVRKKKGDFRRAMRGYDSLLVDDFLDLVADRLEQLVRENLSLQERVARQEQMVTEYRDRERALTEALVSAQEMREEVRRQAAREAELAKSAAQQEASQLRSAAEQDVAQLRGAIEQEVQRLRAAAEQEAVQLRAAAEQEAAQLRAELVELRAAVAIEREREEETVRHLRARQQQFLTSYRAFLERELTELGALAKTLAAVTGADFDEAALDESFDELTAAASAISAADDESGESRTGAAAVAVSLDAEPFEPEPFEPEPFNDELLEPSHGREPSFDEELLQMAALDARVDTQTGAEPALYDGVADDASGDGIPGPIGLGGGADAQAPAWQGGEDIPDVSLREPDDAPLLDLDVIDEPAGTESFDLEDAEDAETDQLLRNAAAAGYLTEEMPAEEELLLDDPVSDAEEDDDDGWLPTLLDDDR